MLRASALLLRERSDLAPSWVSHGGPAPPALESCEPVSSFERGAAVSDLCFGLGGRILLRRRWQDPDLVRTRFINVDTTLYFERDPTGEWIAMRPTRVADDRGVGVAEVVSLDARGRYGRAFQAILANDPSR